MTAESQTPPPTTDQAPDSPRPSRHGWLSVIGPGILVAATGVGAGDLAVGALTGSRLGVAILWAVVIGAAMKYVLNEGIARWQLATGDTLLEGVARHFGRAVLALFLAYLIAWSFFVGAALMSACGIAAHALLPWGDPVADKIFYGILHSVAAVVLVLLGGYRLFEKVMSVCIGIMFVTVAATAVMIQPDWTAVTQGLFVPRIPNADGKGLGWTVALIGGVGGTLTILCYGYWIREEGREGAAAISSCRIDLATGYLVTAIFGLGMIILGSRVDPAGKGAQLVVHIGRELQTHLGPVAKWAFLIGAWGAVASSLLGVWQSIPYLFADVCRLLQGKFEEDRIDTQGTPYIGYLLGLAIIPMAGLWMSFAGAQKIYAIVGAAFMPLLAVTLLILNGQKRLVGNARNSMLVVLLLTATMLFFLICGVWEVQTKLSPN